MAAFHALPRARHPERGAEDCSLEIMHGDGVSAEECLHIAVPDEPDHVLARSGVHQRGPHDPEDLSPALLFLPEQLRQDRVVGGPLARHLRLHETELGGAVAAAEEPFGVHEDAVAAVFLGTGGHCVALAHLAGLGRHQVARRLAHDDAIHPGEPGPAPDTPRLDVRGQVGGREKAVREYAVGRRRLEPCIRSLRERRRVKVGRPVLKRGTGRHRERNLMRNAECGTPRTRKWEGGTRNIGTVIASPVPRSEFRVPRFTAPPPDPDPPPPRALAHLTPARRARWRAARPPSPARASASVP